MGSLLQNIVFGKAKYKANTFIGGVSGNLNTPALVAGKIGIPNSRIKVFKIIGDDIEFSVTGEVKYTLTAAAFFNNTAITYFHDQDGKINYIGYSAFSGAKNLTSAIFPSITTVQGGNYTSTGVFCNCSNLVSFSAVKLESTANFMFFGCNKISSFDFPLLNVIKHGSFSGCSALENITTGNVATINSGSFTNCIKLTAFNCDHANEIGSAAFQNCSSMTDIVGLSKATNIIAAAFYGCVNITGPIFAPEVTVIGVQAFYNCHKITDYHFPELLTIQAASTITYTFLNNFAVNTIYAPKANAIGTPVYNSIFQNIKLGCTITVPSSIQTINSGSPDNDIEYAEKTRGAIIVYV
ncbi:leucine-rich repeat protein [Flavobacterium sp. FlaQc-50]|uniref:leucine-rich repeat domain-containing protein n=1 Tax=unclassified Flavobacterium TaxID=196869 RepID=UPI0037563CAD